ncbi:MAG TPA: PASTA domain-containing protein, partial [Nocardioidaceae bacterium]|nr:PASTA domain-containing protein [Nocardioidaceae bacterium]
YTGKKADKVEEQLTELGLEVKLTPDYSETVKEGRIISQNPPGGETLVKGDEIELIVSAGPPPVEVPDVVRQGVEAATQTLEDAGFVVEVLMSDSYIGLGFVYEQDPEGGTMLAKGSTVTIYLV